MGYLTTDKKKITTKTILEMKAAGEKIAQMTAYDFTTAGILDRAGIDAILVGDSASNVMAGNADTLPITVDQMIYHARAVARACQHCLVVCDMPFGSYQVSREEGVRNAIRIMKETGVDAVKMEGGASIADTVRAIVQAGVPVVGHLGLTRRASISLAAMVFVPRKRLRRVSCSPTLMRSTRPVSLPSHSRRCLPNSPRRSLARSRRLRSALAPDPILTDRCSSMPTRWA